MSRFRLTAYLSDPVAERLALASKRKGANRSRIVDKALDRFLSGDGNSGNDQALLRRLDGMSKAEARTERNVAVLLETLSLFIRYYLTVTPPLPKSEQDPARSLGNQRFEVFIGQIGKRLASGQSTIRDVLERIAVHDPDIFSRDLDEQSAEGHVVQQHTSTSPSPRSSSGPAGPGRREEAPAQQGTSAASRPPGAAPGASSESVTSHRGDDHA